jgi:hypothetical protein
VNFSCCFPPAARRGWPECDVHSALYAASELACSRAWPFWLHLVESIIGRDSFYERIVLLFLPWKICRLPQVTVVQAFIYNVSLLNDTSPVLMLFTDKFRFKFQSQRNCWNSQRLK